MLKQLWNFVSGLKPIHWTGAAATVGAILHVIFWNRIKEAVGGFFSAIGEAIAGRLKKWWLNLTRGKKSKRLTGFQAGKLVQRVTDMEAELKTVKKGLARCDRERNRCEAKNEAMRGQLANLQSICDTLTRKMLNFEKKVPT